MARRRSRKSGSDGMGGVRTSTPFAAACWAIGDGWSLRPRPCGASGRVSTAATSCRLASNASRVGTAVCGVPANTILTGPSVGGLESQRIDADADRRKFDRAALGLDGLQRLGQRGTLATRSPENQPLAVLRRNWAEYFGVRSPGAVGERLYDVGRAVDGGQTSDRRQVGLGAGGELARGEADRVGAHEGLEGSRI